MKLAELIKERGDAQKRIEHLRNRLNSNALRQEKRKTPEDPEDILKELEELFTRLEYLILKINLTNNQYNLVQLLAKRDTLFRKISIYRDFLSTASGGVHQYTKTEIAILPNVNIPKLQSYLDVLAKEYRELEIQIQEKNWTIDVE